MAEDNGTVEYAVACSDGCISEHGFSRPGLALRYDAQPTTVPPKEVDLWMDHYGKFSCGPHRVVQRTVSPWTPVDDQRSGEK